MTDPEDGLEIQGRDTFDADEAAEAVAYWSGISFEGYKKDRLWTRQLGDLVAPYSPASVFEFGCCAGKNLRHLQSILPNARISGIDINLKAVLYARENGIDAALGDDHVLPMVADNRFDVSFTISVLDHLPYPIEALKQLVRISRKAVILCEPWLGEEGKVVRNVTPKGTVIDTTPYSYSWDYEKILTDLGLKFSVSPVDMQSNLGRYYVFYVITP